MSKAHLVNFKKYKSIKTLLDKQNYICFLDFEGAQFSHEMIAFGAVFAYLDKNKYVKRNKKPIKCYVKCHSKVGGRVTELTGITNKDLDAKGIDFGQALKQIKKYCGYHFSKTLFAVFGNFDCTIFQASIERNLSTPMDVANVINNNFFDIQSYLSTFCKDKNGNPYSLENYCKVFGLVFEGTPHDPQYDAYNLMRIYDAAVRNPDIRADEYAKTIISNSHISLSIKRVVESLLNGEDVTAEQFKQYLKEETK